jgi:hypothetical protein
MQDDRTISVNADDLLQLAYFAAQGILEQSEDDSMDNLEHEGEIRAELGQMLARAFGYSNMAADTLGADEPPYSQAEILEALAGALTARRQLA